MLGFDLQLGFGSSAACSEASGASSRATRIGSVCFMAISLLASCGRETPEVFRHDCVLAPPIRLTGGELMCFILY